MANIQRITPTLWFDQNAEEAMGFYTSVFPNSRIVSIERYPDEELNEHFVGFKGKVINGIFELFGQKFICLDGGPLFKFTEAISLTLSCKDQEEIDNFWSKLSHVPESEACGWCKDQFGISWQILPENLGELMKGPGPMQALMNMKKIVIADLEAAAKIE